MYKGRHCVESDYYLLVKETDKILLLLKDEEVEVLPSLLKYIEFISDFDEDIASKIRFHLDKNNINRSTMIDVITRNVDELKQNVIVDLKEHR